MQKADLITIRDFVPDDLNFIMATWLRGLKFGNDWFELIDSDSYYSVYHSVIELILANTGTEIKVACLKEDPGVILGYSVYNGDKAHWCHVKSAWRKIGIAKSLMPKEIKTVTHLTVMGKRILDKKDKTIKFNPFLIP
jgi:hypothetical protein